MSLSNLWMKECTKPPCSTSGAYNYTIDNTTMAIKLTANNSIEFDVYRLAKLPDCYL